MVLDIDGLLDVDDLPDEIAALAKSGGGQDFELPTGADGLVGRPLSDIEKFYIQKSLELTNGNREEAASVLGISERTLYRKIKEYDLKG
jgi:two-component system response regulator HydG